MDKEIEELIAKDLFDVWKEAKQEFGDEWDGVTFESLPEKHKHEYYLTAQRIMGYHKHEPDGELRAELEFLLDHPNFTDEEVIVKILTLIDKPPAPVLSKTETTKIIDKWLNGELEIIHVSEVIAEAQRDTDHKYYTGKSIGGEG